MNQDIDAMGARQKPGTLYNIQALRAVAAYLVVLVHAGEIFRPAGIGPRLTHFGHSGVDLFFVISGFIMVYTTGLKKLRPETFLLHRIARVVPLYWAVTIVVFAIASYAPQLMGATVADVGQLVKSLLFVPFLKSNGEVHPIVFLGWTLNYEMFFYVLFAVGLFFSDQRRGVALTAVSLIALIAAGRLVGSKGILLSFYSDPIMLEFAFGMGIALAMPFNQGRSRSWYLPFALFTIGACFAVIVVNDMLLPQVHRVLSFGVPAAVIVSMAVALEHNGLQLKNAIVRKLGDASYSIYLSHFFVTQAFVKIEDKLNLQSSALSLVVLGGTLIAVTVLGIGVHEWIEKPLTKLARRALEGHIRHPLEAKS